MLLSLPLSSLFSCFCFLTLWPSCCFRSEPHLQRLNPLLPTSSQCLLLLYSTSTPLPLHPSSVSTHHNHSISPHVVRTTARTMQKRLRRDSVMPALSDGVTIQSRLKTPPSAFKKMFKVRTNFSNERKELIFDLCLSLHLRLIWRY